MESSRRAVESYWRSLMIDGATSDEDKVTPVYKLEEICDLLRSSHVSIVKEVADFIFKRLQHKSPVVKQKALRLIKYEVGKSGVEFRREMQRNSVAVRQLIYYKGESDPLKGDALNKAVRDTAQEALSAIFSGDDSNKLAATESLSQRIKGFGNTNFDAPSEDKKSFLSEVVGLGSATIMQGFNSLTQGQSQSKNDGGSYRSPNLHRSLTTESGYSKPEVQHSSRFLNRSNGVGGAWAQDNKPTQLESENGNSNKKSPEEKSREERLLETIVTSGGVRLQPTRDALQIFLLEASKLDGLALTRALESKLQSPLWQVRMKAVCVLEAILRKKDDNHLSVAVSYFSENQDAVVKCSESPQASLREKANKVLNLLCGEQSDVGFSQSESKIKPEAIVANVPNLIETDEPYGSEDTSAVQIDEGIPIHSTSLIDDLFNDNLATGRSSSLKPKNSDDPFVDVSFDIQNCGQVNVATDIFSGLKTIDEAKADEAIHMATTSSGPELDDIFGSNFQPPDAQGGIKGDVTDIMAGMSVHDNKPTLKQNGGISPAMFSDSTSDPSHQFSNNVLNSLLGPQAAAKSANPTSSHWGPVAYNAFAPVNPMAFPSQPINYGAMGSLLSQQQLLVTMSNLQQGGNLHSLQAASNHASGTQVGGYSMPLPDIFHPSTVTQLTNPAIKSSKKEETKAFDFISDHLSAARDPKRVN